MSGLRANSSILQMLANFNRLSYFIFEGDLNDVCVRASSDEQWRQWCGGRWEAA
jgi:hypothetical protein